MFTRCDIQCSYKNFAKNFAAKNFGGLLIPSSPFLQYVEQLGIAGTTEYFHKIHNNGNSE